MRVSKIRNKLDLSELYHVAGKENVADIGTRPELLTVDQLMPGSEFLCCKSWMTRPVDEAVNSGVIKGVADIKLDNESKRLLKEGILMESSLNTVSMDNAKLALSQKDIDREKYS